MIKKLKKITRQKLDLYYIIYICILCNIHILTYMCNVNSQGTRMHNKFSIRYYECKDTHIRIREQSIIFDKNLMKIPVARDFSFTFFFFSNKLTLYSPMIFVYCKKNIKLITN